MFLAMYLRGNWYASTSQITQDLWNEACVSAWVTVTSRAPCHPSLDKRGKSIFASLSHWEVEAICYQPVTNHILTDISPLSIKKTEG